MISRLYQQIGKDKILFLALIVLLLYLLIALGSQCGLIASDWNKTLAAAYQAPSLKFLIGTDIFGRSVLSKLLQASFSAIAVALVANLIAISLGLLLASLAALASKGIDRFVVWFYSVVGNLPSYLFILLLSYLFGSGFWAICLAIGLTSWVPLCRQLRTEIKREKKKSYFVATEVLGVGRLRQVITHLLPNLSHLIFIDFILRFSFAVKAEAILSYLGLGLLNRPSWGVMIAEAREEIIRGVYGQFIAASLAIFFLLLAINIVASRLRQKKFHLFQ